MFQLFMVISVPLTLLLLGGMVVIYFLEKDKQAFSFRTLFSAYFYIVAIISLLAIFLGMTSVTKAVLSDAFGREFSYHTYTDYPVIDPAGEPTKEGEPDPEKIKREAKQMEEERVEAEYADDLFNGISMAIVGLLFLGVHVWGWRKLAVGQKQLDAILYKGYIMTQLGVYGLISLVALPIGLSQWMRYLWASNSVTNMPTPGEVLSIALWSTPIWLFFIWLTIRTMRHQEAK